MEYQLTLNWPDFLERHWQKRPVVLKRGFNNFIDPISPDELAGLAMESEVGTVASARRSAHASDSLLALTMTS